MNPRSCHCLVPVNVSVYPPPVSVHDRVLPSTVPSNEPLESLRLRSYISVPALVTLIPSRSTVVEYTVIERLTLVFELLESTHVHPAEPVPETFTVPVYVPVIDDARSGPDSSFSHALSAVKIIIRTNKTVVFIVFDFRFRS